MACSSFEQTFEAGGFVRAYPVIFILLKRIRSTGVNRGKIVFSDREYSILGKQIPWLNSGESVNRYPSFMG